MEVIHRHKNLTWTTQAYTSQLLERPLTKSKLTPGPRGCLHRRGFSCSAGREICLKCGMSRHDAEGRGTLGGTMGAPGPVPPSAELIRTNGSPFSPEVIRAMRSRATGPVLPGPSKGPLEVPGPGSYDLPGAFPAGAGGRRRRRPASAPPGAAP